MPLQLALTHLDSNRIQGLERVLKCEPTALAAGVEAESLAKRRPAAQKTNIRTFQNTFSCSLAESEYTSESFSVKDRQMQPVSA
jgi:hypothetical protein